MFASDEPLSRAGFALAATASAALLLASSAWAWETSIRPVVVPEWFGAVPFMLVLLAPLISIVALACSVAGVYRVEDVDATRTALAPSVFLLLASIVFVFLLLFSG